MEICLALLDDLGAGVSPFDLWPQLFSNLSVNPIIRPGLRLCLLLLSREVVYYCLWSACVGEGGMDSIHLL